MFEQWKDVPGYEGYYQVSDMGRVKSLARVNYRGNKIKERILKPRTNTDGYYSVSLHKDNKRKTFQVHSLVLKAFVGERPEKYVCCHGNGVKKDNHLSNLRWGSSKDNTADAKMHGTIARGERHGNAKLTFENVLKIKQLLAYSNMKQEEIAKEFNVVREQISKIKLGKRWKHVSICA